jgi:hypothetical protein
MKTRFIGIMQKRESRIEAVEIDVAAIMAGLRGHARPTGKKGSTGQMGDKGGIKLSGK